MGGGIVPGAAAQLQPRSLPSPQKQLPATPAQGAGAAGRSSRPQLCCLGAGRLHCCPPVARFLPAPSPAVATSRAPESGHWLE